MSDQPYKDLIVLVADKNMEAAFRGLLCRYQALGIREISFDIFVHPNKDPGCRGESHRFLQSFSNRYRFALVVFDREGCGSEEERASLENNAEQKLASVGWSDRATVIVLDPELEIWLWNRSPHVERVLGWRDQAMPLRTWLVQNGLLLREDLKPERPKETLEVVLRKAKRPRSSSIYLQIAEQVSLTGHNEPAFRKLLATLRMWFSQEQD